MPWNFHNYYANRNEGLISELRLTDAQESRLLELRDTVRARIRDVFDEAKNLVRNTNNDSLSVEAIQVRLRKTRLRYLTPETQEEAGKLISSMDGDARTAFLALSPRFWTQGSFRYKTLNQPYSSPPQEIDIDDGTYLPMQFFENEPAIGHRLLILLVDSSLQSLVAENDDWVFTTKPTCARIKIPKEHTHIDVPMYAIPEKQFLEKEQAFVVLKHQTFDGRDSINEAIAANRADYQLQSDCVHLALREGDQKWTKSDPKIVEDWFSGCCARIGQHLKKLCRFLKGWRDCQWPDGGGPSSICLMAAAVNVLHSHPHDRTDFGDAMRVLSHYLPEEFQKGIESPDHTDAKKLFPAIESHGDKEQDILNKLFDLENCIGAAFRAETKRDALGYLRQVYGNRVKSEDLIIKQKSAAAFKSEAEQGQKSETISTSMISGTMSSG